MNSKRFFLLALLPLSACDENHIKFPSSDTGEDTDLPDTDTADTAPDTDTDTGEALPPGARFETDRTVADADILLLSKYDDDNVGWENGLAMVPDLDGDGADEILVAAKNHSATTNSWEGMAYLFSNPPAGTSMLTLAPTQFVGAEPSGMFGTAVASVGDVNGDGYTDVAISAAHDGPGIVHVFHGPFGPGSISSAASDTQLTGENAGSYTGMIVRGAGDVDADGRDDVLTSSYYGDGCDDCGTVFISFAAGDGGPVSLATDSFRVVGGGSRGPISDAAVTGDFDGDGWLDLFVGAPGTTSGGAGIWYGPLTDGSSTLNDADAWFTGSAGGYAGVAVAALDLDGDGDDEIVVGAPYAADGGTNAGAVYILPGGARYSGTNDLLDGTVLLGAPSDYAGMGFAAPADVDHDGSEDLLVNSSFGNQYDSAAGITWLYYGGALAAGSSTLADAAVAFAGDEPGSMTGGALAVGDFDGDGASDVALGSMIASAPSTGGVFVFLGD